MIAPQFTINEIATALQVSRQAVRKRATRECWPFQEKTAKGGKRRLYNLSDLPTRIQTVLLTSAESDENKASKTKPVQDKFTLWNRYDTAPQSMKDEAQRRVNALNLYECLCANGIKKAAATTEVANQFNANRATLYRWQSAVKGYDASDWLAVLVPGYCGRTKEAECTPEAWEFFKADFLRLEADSVAACYKRLARTAVKEGWDIPAKRTIERWASDKIPATIRILKREGELALMSRYPAIERSVKDLYATQWINGDGYQHNVFVRWPDGTIDRPKTWFWQDIHSRKLLSYRVDKTENTDSIRLAFGDLVEDYGIPEHVTIDNTRAAANKWMTGGTPNRYRFKVKEDDPLGIFTLLGIQVHWTSVNKAGTQAKGHGQAKPIERAFGMGGLGSYVDKHPDFSGAYTGENTTAKPENYGETAVPLDRFIETLNQEIIAWNADKGRRTEMALGIKSFDQVFNESYARAPIRKATEAQRRLWLLAAESVTVKNDGTFTLAAGARTGEGSEGRNRYYASELQEVGESRQKIVVRFDPSSLYEEAFAYTLDGRFIARAQCIEAAGFGDSDAGRTWNRARRQFIKATKQAADAEQRMSLADMTERLERPSLPDSIASKVVRPHRPAAAPEPIQADPAAVERAQAALAKHAQSEDVQLSNTFPAYNKHAVAIPFENQDKAETYHRSVQDVDHFSKAKSPAQRYKRWLFVNEQMLIGIGYELQQDEVNWHAGYQGTSEYGSQKILVEEFGLTAIHD